MPHKTSASERIGGPGASHENRDHPERSKPRNAASVERATDARSNVSGGGGKADLHHDRNSRGKAGK